MHTKTQPNYDLVSNFYVQIYKNIIVHDWQSVEKIPASEKWCIFIQPEIIGSVVISQLSEVASAFQNIVSYNQTHKIGLSVYSNLNQVNCNQKFLKNKCFSHFQFCAKRVSSPSLVFLLPYTLKKNLPSPVESVMITLKLNCNLQF